MQHTDPALWIVDGPEEAALTVVFAHGAGLPMDSPFMEYFAKVLSDRGYRVVRFEFPYMAARRTGGPKRAPNQLPVLQATWYEVIDELGADRLVISGKSMGGRIASVVADQHQVAGMVCLGYPFHPPGKPENLRVEHLRELQTPTLILQGERDPFGRSDEVEGYQLAKSIRVEWIPDGEHSFKPRKSSGRTEEENLKLAADHFIDFCNSRNI